MRERTARDGTITYQVLFRDGGKQRSKTFGDTASAQKFTDLIGALGVKRALAELDGITDAGPTLDDIAERFFTWKASRVRSDRTVADYRRDYANWISRPLGWRVAASIDEMDVQDWVESMQGRLSPKSIHDRHAILHGIFKYASAPTRALVPAGHNPAIGTELPRKVRTMLPAIRPAEWQALHAALRRIDADAADLAEFLAATGWRFSEATALSTHDVTDDGQAVHVTVARVARRTADGSVQIVSDTKSVAGQRRQRLDADTADLVRRRLDAASPGGLVFATNGGSLWNYSHFRRRFWGKAQSAAGIERPIRIHWLRHLAVAQFVASGMDLTEVQRRIGHEHIGTTIGVYGGMIDGASDESLDRLAAIRRAGRAVDLPEVAFEIDE